MKFTAEQERILLDDSADPLDRASAISCMRSDGIQKHEMLIVSLLDHPSPDLRADALHTLLRWGGRDYVPVALDWLSSDDDVLRIGMCSPLVSCCSAFPEYRERILRALAARVEKDSDMGIVVTAYESIRRALYQPRLFFDFRTFDRIKDVDWKLLAPYRSAGSKNQSTSN